MRQTFYFTVAMMLAAFGFAGGGSAFSLLPSTYSLALPSQYAPEFDVGQLSGKRPKMEGLILGGLAGNLAGSIGLFWLGSHFPSPGDELVAMAAIVGTFAGSTCGSALGVCLAGNTRYWRGRFASALLGSSLGIVSAFLVTMAAGDDSPTLSLLSLALLPPLGSAILFNSTLERRASRTRGALFSLAGRRLELGVPDVQVRPISVPGLNARPEMRFHVRVLSVEL